MIPEKNTLNPFAFFASVMALSIFFFIYLSLRPVPADPETYVYLANLRGITESGFYFGMEEPLSILLLYFWKSLFNLNYLTTFQSLASFLMSLSIHLILLLFYKKEWKLNHYFLVYLSAFLPYTHEFPVVFFNELLGLLFILLIFHTFRMERLFDLLLFPLLVLAAFFADLRFFLFGFTVFVVYSSLRAGEKVRNKTTVFYKKKNIPHIILLSYTGFLILTMILMSSFDFFSDSSFGHLIYHWGLLALHLAPAFALLGLGKILLDTEKELRTITFTAILGIATIGVILWNYSRYDSTVEARLEAETEVLARSIPMIGDATTIYVPQDIANYLYFKTKIPMRFVQDLPVPDRSFLRVEEIWQADVNEITKLYGTKRPRRPIVSEVIPINDKTVFLKRELEERILKESPENPIRRKVEESGSRLLRLTPYMRYLEWQQEIIGFSHLQKVPI